MRKLILIAVCCSTFVSSCWAKEPVVPDWFRPDPKNPYAIFDACEISIRRRPHCTGAVVVFVRAFFTTSGASQLAIAS